MGVGNRGQDVQGPLCHGQKCRLESLQEEEEQALS